MDGAVLFVSVRWVFVYSVVSVGLRAFLNLSIVGCDFGIGW